MARQAKRKNKKYEEWKNNNGSSRRSPQYTRNQHKTWICMSKKFICFSFRRFAPRLFVSVLYLIVGNRCLGYGVVADCHKDHKTRLAAAQRIDCRMFSSLIFFFRKCDDEIAKAEICYHILLIEWHDYCADESRLSWPNAKNYCHRPRKCLQMRTCGAHGNENVRNRKFGTCACTTHTLRHKSSGEQTRWASTVNGEWKKEKKMKSLSRKITLSYHIFPSPPHRPVKTMIAVFAGEYTVCILMQHRFPSPLPALLFHIRATSHYYLV